MGVTGWWTVGLGAQGDSPLGARAGAQALGAVIMGPGASRAAPRGARPRWGRPELLRSQGDAQVRDRGYLSSRLGFSKTAALAGLPAAHDNQDEATDTERAHYITNNRPRTAKTAKDRD